MDYTPEISGLNGSIQFVVDVTDSDLNPFPGASFTKGYLTYNGALIKNPALRGNTVLWNAYPYNCSNSHCRLNYSATHPQNCSTRSSTVGSTLRFTEPGEVHIRLAWGLAPYAPVQGVKVLDSCTYSVVEPITCYQGQGSISSTSGGCGGDFFSVTCSDGLIARSRRKNADLFAPHDRNAFCLRGNLKCGINCTGPDATGKSDLGRLCALQQAFCSPSDMMSGATITAYWGSTESCPLGLTSSVFSDYPSSLTQLTCCNTDGCNKPGTPPPQPTCVAASFHVTEGYCMGLVSAFKTCSVGTGFAQAEADQTAMVGASRPPTRPTPRFSFSLHCSPKSALFGCRC